MKPPAIRQLTIANQYLHGEVGANEAATQLTTYGPFGKLLAGEVILDNMTTDRPYMASTHAELAKHHYRGVVEQTGNGLWEDGYDHAGSRVRAQMRLSQMRAVESLYGQRRLPKRSVVAGMYRNLLGLAAATVDSTMEHDHDDPDSAAEVRGTLGELAVLLLAQRFALREVGTDEWLPLQSSFYEDNAGNCLVRHPADYPWDMNIFTRSDPGHFPSKTYTLQIKTFNDGSAEPPPGPTLYISPDLALPSEKRRVGEIIIRSCAIEAAMPNDAKRLSHELDRRTEQLLTVLEKEHEKEYPTAADSASVLQI